MNTGGVPVFECGGRSLIRAGVGICDQRAGRSLGKAIEGKGAFRRFKNRLHENYPGLLPALHAFQSARAKRRAIEWLVDHSLVDHRAAAPIPAGYPDPELP